VKTSSKYHRLLDEHGVKLLEDFGVADIALKRDHALLAIDFLRSDGIPILGGDVYFQVGSSLELAYASWFTKRRAGEDFDLFVKRTCLETIDYIDRFPPRIGATPLFALVADER